MEAKIGGGGSRKDRVFKVCVRMPEGVGEGEVMDYIEEAVSYYTCGKPWRINPDSVVVKRAHPKYSEMCAT